MPDNFGRIERIFVIGTAVALVIFATGVLIRLNRGPRYQGKPAAYWVEQLTHDNAQARQALRKIGPAAVPALAEAVNRRRSRFRSLLESWRPRLPSLVARKLPNRALDQLLEEHAIEVLYEFGPEAAPAVPALIGVGTSLNDVIGFGSSGLAHATLLRIGPAGLPYFIPLLRGKNPNTRAQAASFIAHLGPEAGAAAPALARALNDSSPVVRNAAVIAISSSGLHLLSPTYFADSTYTPSIWPVLGHITDSFGERLDPFSGEGAFHTGVDVASDYGAPVHATADGIIAIAENHAGYGRLVVIDHGFGITTWYAHLSAFSAVAGARVKRGEVLGYTGISGRSTGPHVHYEVRMNNAPINPWRYMKSTPAGD